MMLRKKKEVEDDEELERLLKEDEAERDGPGGDGGYLKVKIEIEGLRELTQAIEELVETLRTKTK
ncbi:MAG: hypothetical protein ABWJ97_06600 [Thermoproteus sp.]